MTMNKPNYQNITPELLKEIGVSRPCLVTWLTRYRVNGKKLGIKIAGRWKVYPDVLREFLTNGGEAVEAIIQDRPLWDEE